MKPPIIRSDFWRRFFRNRLAVSGLVIVGFFFLVSIAAPLISPFDPNVPDRISVLSPPDSTYYFGTDESGRDVFSRMVWGSRISIKVGFVAVGIAILIGTMLGAVAGYYGGTLDGAVMRFVDVMLCFPSFFLILAVIAILEPSIYNIMIVIGITGWMGVARLVRAEFLTLTHRDFVLAARSQGAGDFGSSFPTSCPTPWDPSSYRRPSAWPGPSSPRARSRFSGIGVQPPTPSWGNILTEGKDSIDVAWWLSLYPGLAILLTVLGYNLLGEGIRDALDPRLRDRSA